MENNIRKIAILTDVHALLEPLEAVFDDIKNRKITEIYSLGDNIGLGPNPSEVLELLEQNNVKSIAGNSEEYIMLGTAPFTYFDQLKEKSQLWTLSKINEHQLGTIFLYPHSIDLVLGGKKIGLCHFANDVRFDYSERSTWTYQNKLKFGLEGYKQFEYTNSPRQLEEVNSNNKNNPFFRGYVSALNDPIFGQNTVDKYEAIIQGHVHWKMYEKSSSTNFYSIRALGMAYGNDPIDTASYVIISECQSGYKLEEILVKYDRQKMVYSVLNCDNLDKTIQRFINITNDEITKRKK